MVVDTNYVFCMYGKETLVRNIVHDISQILRLKKLNKYIMIEKSFWLEDGLI